MTRITGTFAAVGSSGAFQLRGGEKGSYEVGEVPAEAAVLLERSTDGGQTWQTAATLTAAASGDLLLPGRYRLRCTALGEEEEITYELGDTDDVLWEMTDRDGNRPIVVRQSGVTITGLTATTVAAGAVTADSVESAEAVDAPAASPWVTIAASRYTATPASSSQITMSDTDGLAVGLPVRYEYDGGTYYGIITALVADTSITIAGAPLDTEEDLTSLAVGPATHVRQVEYQIAGTYGDDTADLLATDMAAYSRWRGPAARLVAVSAVHATADTGANQPKVNVKVGGDAVLTQDTAAGITLSTAGTWVNGSAVAIDPDAAVLADGDAIEIACTAAGSNSDAEDLTVQVVIVLA